VEDLRSSTGGVMAADRPVRTLEDLERAVRALATEFKTDKVFIIGSRRMARRSD
jgi:hypothetical protein